MVKQKRTVLWREWGTQLNSPGAGSAPLPGAELRGPGRREPPALSARHRLRGTAPAVPSRRPDPGRGFLRSAAAFPGSQPWAAGLSGREIAPYATGSGSSSSSCSRALSVSGGTERGEVSGCPASAVRGLSCPAPAARPAGAQG